MRLGKTTLVGKVFNKKVIEHFDCRAWITVSPSYTVEGLMRDLLKKLCKENRVNPPQGISEMDRVSLIDEKFGVNAMLDNKNGSRILITTRKKDVIESSMKSPLDKVHELKPLTQEESMQLFCKKAFRCHKNRYCPEDLKKVSSDFVEKCKGLPLAIVAIGSLLFGKEKTPFVWEKKIR
ncbi:Disease resistance protein RPM1 [Glycine soja]